MSTTVHTRYDVAATVPSLVLCFYLSPTDIQEPNLLKLFNFNPHMDK